MKIIFIHQNFPGQFRHLAPALVRQGHEVTALGLKPLKDESQTGIKYHRYSISRGNTPDQHPWLIDFESKIIRGQACLQTALALRESGYSPDVIIAHHGWGESLFAKEVWPTAKLGIYCEFFHRPVGQDVGFDSEFQDNDEHNRSRVRLKNVNDLLHMEIADAALSPTQWQASTYPEYFRKKITVAHEGIDTAYVKPNAEAFLTLNNSIKLTAKDQIITFVNRNLEPLRGFHSFMRSLPRILQEAPDARVLIVGSDKQGYGSAPPTGDSWVPHLVEEIKPDMREADWQRVHFLGMVPYQHYLSILQVSSVHVYLTYPFVLSWSLLEAMSAGCTIVGSATPPVKEVISDGVTGVLTDFFDSNDIANSVVGLLNDEQQRRRLGLAARLHIQENMDLKNICLPKQLQWVYSV